MKFLRLWLKAYGPFDDAALDFEGAPNLHLIYGPNEAGKSSALRAITALLFGISAQTRDNFRHDYSTLRIGAVLLDDDGQRHAVMRRKGNKATLFPFDETSGREQSDQALSTEYFAQLLGELDATAFTTLFGIDHVRLREGGQELLDGQGELGKSLFQAASGLTGVGRLLTELEKSAADLFKPGGKNPSINLALHDYAELRRKLKDAQIRPAAWEERREALQRAESEAGALQERMRHLRAEEKRLTRLRATLPLLAEREWRRRELAAVQDAPLLAEDAASRRVQAETGRGHAERDVREAEALMTAYEAEWAGLDVPETLLAHGPDIEALHHDQARAAGAREKMQRSEALFARARAQVEEVLARLEPGTLWRDARGLLPDRAVVKSVRDLITQRAKVESVLAGERENAGELERDLDATRAELKKLPEAPDLSALKSTLATLTRQGDLEALADQAGVEADKLGRRLADEIAALGLADAVALRRLVLPQDSEIEQCKEAFAGIRQSLLDLAKEEKRVRHDLNNARAEMKGLEAVGEVVTATRVRAAREKRDEDWRRVRQVFVEGVASNAAPTDLLDEADLPNRYETTVRHADNLADELRADTARATKYVEYSTRVEQMEARLRAIEAERQALQTAEEERRLAWLARLQSIGLRPLEPEALREWLKDRQRVLDLLEQREKIQARAESAVKAVERARADLAAVRCEADLPEAEAGASLAAQLAVTGEAVAAGERRHEAHAQCRKELARLHKEQERCAARLQEAEARQEELGRAWKRAVGGLHLPATATAIEAESRIEDLEHLGKALDEAERQDATLTGERAFFDAYRARAAALALALGREAPADERIAAGAERWYGELEAGRKAAARRSVLDAALRQERERKTRARVALAAAEEELRRLLHAAACADAAELPAAEARSAERRELEARTRDLDGQLVKQWHVSVESLIEEAAGHEPETVASALAEIQQEIEAGEPRLAEAQQAVADARREFAALDGAGRAAGLREDMEALLAQLRRDAEEYARVKLARSLLERGIHGYRDRAQGPLLQRAGHYFARMTGGRYPRLRVDFEHDAQIILAEREDGSDLRIVREEMSEGTADQLYLALRLAAIELHLEARRVVPVVLDDVLLTFDDRRAACTLQALADLAVHTQVLVFTHHRHLLEVARGSLPAEGFGVVELGDDGRNRAG